ncbi:MAG TPA: ATP-binding cassette domain-containing protein [Cyclobacteriaceae bacterium]|nr:ATP-binding cassette domain-containing protein [Cyclobacteriaceae bacterium]
MIEITNVTCARSGRKLFQNFNWRIGDGEHWLVTGPNGSGKTILLEMLAGIQHVQNGSITYDFVTGATWDEQFDQRRQSIQYIPTHSIRSLIPGDGEQYYQQRYYSLGDEINVVKVRDILPHIHPDLPSTFQVASLLNLDVKRLSNGQLKKVLILQRMGQHFPKLLLLDYPFEGLDRASRKDLCDFIDFIVDAYSIRVIIVDQGHELPRCITRKLTLREFRIESQEKYIHRDDVAKEVASHSDGRAHTDEVVVEIRNLSIKYDETVILHDFNWSVRRGERWAMVGRNGSGKTTVFSIIYADHPMAYSQEVYLFGKRRGSGESIWDIKNRINYMGPEKVSYLNPQYMTITAAEYVESKDKDKLGELVQFFDAGLFINRPMRELSSGQLQLVLLINYFMSTRELLLLDEPFQFLDVHQRDRVAEYLQKYLRDDATLVLITHYDEDLARWTEKTVRL